MDANHTLFAKTFEEEVSNLVRGVWERQLAKKKPNVFSYEMS